MIELIVCQRRITEDKLAVSEDTFHNGFGMDNRLVAYPESLMLRSELLDFCRETLPNRGCTVIITDSDMVINEFRYAILQGDISSRELMLTIAEFNGVTGGFYVADRISFDDRARYSKMRPGWFNRPFNVAERLRAM